MGEVWVGEVEEIGWDGRGIDKRAVERMKG